MMSRIIIDAACPFRVTPMMSTVIVIEQAAYSRNDVACHHCEIGTRKVCVLGCNRRRCAMMSAVIVDTRTVGRLADCWVAAGGLLGGGWRTVGWRLAACGPASVVYRVVVGAF